MICDIMIEKMNATSDHMVGNNAGRSLPSRSIRASRDSSEPMSRVGSVLASVSLEVSGMLGLGGFEMVRNRLDLRWNTLFSNRPSAADALEVTRSIDVFDPEYFTSDLPSQCSEYDASALLISQSGTR